MSSHHIPLAGKSPNSQGRLRNGGWGWGDDAADIFYMLLVPETTVVYFEILNYLLLVAINGFNIFKHACSYCLLDFNES